MRQCWVVKVKLLTWAVSGCLCIELDAASSNTTRPFHPPGDGWVDVSRKPSKMHWFLITVTSAGAQQALRSMVSMDQLPWPLTPTLPKVGLENGPLGGHNRNEKTMVLSSPPRLGLACHGLALRRHPLNPLPAAETSGALSRKGR